MARNSDLRGVQNQIRSNATELRAYQEDILVWEREQQNRGSTISPVEQRTKPPPRRASPITVEHDTQERNESEPAQQPDRSDESSEVLRLRGNDRFKTGQYEEAVRCYEEAVANAQAASATCDVRIIVNLAQAQFKLGKWRECEANCTKALHMDATAVKALWRRADARSRLGKLRSALFDLEDFARLRPDDPHVGKAIQSLKDRLLTNIADPNPGQKKVDAATQEVQKSKQKNDSLKTKQRDSVIEASKGYDISTNVAKAVPLVIEVVSEDEDDQENGSLPSGDHVDNNAANREYSTDMRQVEINDSNLPSKSVGEHAATPTSFVVETPRSGYEFETQFRRANSIEHRFAILSSIPQGSLKKMLMASLDSTLLQRMLEAIIDCGIQGDATLAIRMLHELTFVERFDMALLFLEDSMRNKLSQSLHRLSALGIDTTSLMEQYNIAL